MTEKDKNTSGNRVLSLLGVRLASLEVNNAMLQAEVEDLKSKLNDKVKGDEK